MKRMFALLISLLLVTGLFLMPCRSYAVETIDETTAATLVKNARNIMKSYLDIFQWFDAELNDSSRDIIVKNYPGYNVEVHLKPVRDGYDQEGVKRLVSETFTGSLAENYLNSSFSERFFEKYHEENGALYYPWFIGAQVKDHTGLVLNDEDIDALTISDDGKALVHTKYFPHFHEELSKVTTVIFSFEKEDGVWKVSGMDSTEALFGLYDETIDLSSFSVELAKTEIMTVVGEIYRLAHVDGDVFGTSIGLRDLQPSEPEKVDKFGETFYRINGALGSTETWLNYCSRFTTGEIADLIVKGGQYCVDVDGRMFYRSRTDLCEQYLKMSFDENVSPEIISAGDESATVKVSLPLSIMDSFGNSNDVNAELIFEFASVNGRWIITGGDFIEKLDSLYALNTGSTETKAGQPDTGDDGNAALLIAVVMLALAVVVLRKNRRISD